MRAPVFLIVVAVALAGGAAYWGLEQSHQPEPHPPSASVSPKEPGVLRFPVGGPQLSMLSIAAIANAPVPLAEPLHGRVALDESHTARISSPVPGRIVELRAQLGDPVSAGAILAVIDAPDLGAAQADLAKAKADEHRKELALKRARELFAGEVMPRKDLEAAEADLAQVKAETERAALRLANLNPRRAPLAGQRLTLVSPIGGVIAERKANTGMEVRPDLPDPLFVIADLKRLQVIIDLPEQHLAKVVVGHPIAAEVDAWPAERFLGRVERIAPSVDPVTRRIQVRCSVDNAAAKLRPEMYARVTLLADAHRIAMRVPNSALVTEGLYSFVFVEREVGVFEKRKVELTFQDREQSYVAAGLKPDERIVVRGALLLNSELASGG